MSTKPNPLIGAGYTATTVTGLVRAIKDIYALIAVREGVAAPSIRFGRRLEALITAPPSIAIVMKKGPWGGSAQMGSGRVGAIAHPLSVHIWAPEPTIGEDELENELLRFDEADPMLARFLNVLARVAPSRIEPMDVDPDADQSRAASVNHYGETYVVAFRFIRDIARDENVFAALPTLDANRKPTPRLSPPTYDTPPGTPATTVEIEMTTSVQEPS